MGGQPVRDLRPVGCVHLRDVQHRVPLHRPSLGYQTASTLGGGVSPLIAASLAAAGGFPPVTVYLMVTFAVALVIIWISKESARADLHRQLEVPGETHAVAHTRTA